MSGHIVNNQPDTTLPLHRHDDARIILVLEGEVRETDLIGPRVYQRGELLFRPPYCAHSNAGGETPSSFLRVSVPQKAWLALTRRNGWRALRGRIDLDGRENRAILRSRNRAEHFVELIAAQSDMGACDHCGPDIDTGQFLLTEQGSLSAFAAARNMQPYQFTRLFLKRFGMTPTAYRREFRMRRALSLLAFSNYSLAQVAAACKYADQSHLSREVKSATQLSPSAFRCAVA